MPAPAPFGFPFGQSAFQWSADLQVKQVCFWLGPLDRVAFRPGLPGGERPVDCVPALPAPRAQRRRSPRARTLSWISYGYAGTIYGIA